MLKKNILKFENDEDSMNIIGLKSRTHEYHKIDRISAGKLQKSRKRQQSLESSKLS
jgi:hypothetical protein